MANYFVAVSTETRDGLAFVLLTCARCEEAKPSGFFCLLCLAEVLR